MAFEHLEHSIGHRKAAEHIRGAEEHGEKRQDPEQGGVSRPGDQHRTEKHDAMDVVLKSGDVLGTVEELYELPQGLALGVNRGGGAGSVLIPYDRVVVSVERDIRRITIDPPDGLLD